MALLGSLCHRTYHLLMQALRDISNARIFNLISARKEKKKAQQILCREWPGAAAAVKPFFFYIGEKM